MSQVIARAEADNMPSITAERGERAVFCGLTPSFGCIAAVRTHFFSWSGRAPAHTYCSQLPA